MNIWKSIGNGVDVIIAPVNNDPILPTTTSRLLKLEIYYRFDGTIPSGTLVNFSFDGAFIGSGTITAPVVPSGKRVVLYAKEMSSVVSINAETGLSYSIRLSTDVVGAFSNTFTETFGIDPASEYPYPPVKNVGITRTGSTYRINWENQVVVGPNNANTGYYLINVEEQAKSANSAEGPYIQLATLAGNGTLYALTFPSDIKTRKFRITPRGVYSRNRAKSTIVTVNKIPSTPANIAVQEIRNGVRLSWSVAEEGVRYYSIFVKTASGTHSFNISTANRYYDFLSLDIGTEYSFAVSHRDDVTGLFSEMSAWSPTIKQLGMIANGKRVTDFRFGNYQPARVYLGDKLIWIR